ncbi:MAG: ABC transporter permease [Bryobacteraceae bacterium]|nr:ABC transporter permease [Bryobacteraceae bacterium]
MRSALRQTWRSLRRAPAFTTGAVLTLSVGIAGASLVFAGVESLLWRTLGYAAEDRLVSLSGTAQDGNRWGLAWPDLREWSRESTTLDGIAGYRDRTYGISASGEVFVIRAGMVTPGFFQILGVPPAIGRWPSPGEPDAAVLSHEAWVKYYASDPAIAQRPILLNESPYRVIAVMPRTFSFAMQGGTPEVYIPLGREFDNRDAASLWGIARLKPGATAASAMQEVQALGARAAKSRPPGGPAGATAVPLLDAVTSGYRKPLALLGGAAELLLMIALANVCHLLISRSLARRKEMAIREALGAKRRDLARIFLFEGQVLAALGTLGGLALSLLAFPALTSALSMLGAKPPAVSPRFWTFALTGVLGVASGLALSGIPILFHNRELAGRFPARRRWSTALVLAQLTLSVPLLLAAGVLWKSYRNLESQPAGFDPGSTLVFGIGIPETRYNTDARMAAFHRDLTTQLASVPGVSKAGFAARLPAAGRALGARFRIASQPADSPQATAGVNAVGADFLNAIRVPLVSGRWFTPADDGAAPRVAIVNQAFERRYLSGIASVLELNWTSESNPKGTRWRVIGVCGDIRSRSLDTEPQPEIYLPVLQFPVEGGSYVVRAEPGAGGVEEALRTAVRRVDPKLERITVRSFREAIGTVLEPRREARSVAGLFGWISLALAAVGLYAALAYQASQRMREMAIRRAVGAGASGTAGLILRQAVGLAGMAFACGWMVFLWLAPSLQPHLYQVQAADFATGAWVLATLLLAAAIAAAGPGWKAARANPAGLLRAE